MGIVIASVALLLGSGLIWWYMRPPISDLEPISQEALNRILKLEAHKGQEP